MLFHISQTFQLRAKRILLQIVFDLVGKIETGHKKSEVKKHIRSV